MNIMNKFLLGVAAGSLLLTVGCGPAATYTVGGDVTFVPDSGQVLTMQINSGETADSAGGYYQFPTALNDTDAYDVQVLTPPTDYSCSFDTANNVGAVAGSNVIDIDVTCTEDTYTVGGTVNGLAGSVTLINTDTTDTVVVSDASPTFTFPGQPNSTAYAVAVDAQPVDQTCTVTSVNGAGSIDGADVTDVVVDCVDNSITRWSDGTAEWPDQACNPTNSFGGCNTNDQVHADAWAAYVCQQNGWLDGIWTGNKIAGCSGEVSMYCRGQIPCTPYVENSCQESDQTQVEITCF